MIADFMPDFIEKSLSGPEGLGIAGLRSLWINSFAKAAGNRKNLLSRGAMRRTLPY
jgi:hypothetical protein